MKRILLILTTLLQLAVLIGCSSGTGEQPGDIYRKYASQPGLAVAQVTDFELCDTVSVDVVMLVADNDSAWQQIVAEFDIRIGEGTFSRAIYALAISRDTSAEGTDDVQSVTYTNK